MFINLKILCVLFSSVLAINVAMNRTSQSQISYIPDVYPETSKGKYTIEQGGIIRGSNVLKNIALIFTGGDFNDGCDYIEKVLSKKNIKANFFFTGDFYQCPDNKKLIKKLVKNGCYLGPHSDKHLLYCSWEKRDSLLITKDKFISDLLANYERMKQFGIIKENAAYFMPPYEWYNDSISIWTKELGLTLINFTPGTLSNADYTIPSMKNYQTSEEIFNSITDYERNNPEGFNGFFLLLHIGTHPDRKDKFYFRLEELIDFLERRGYSFLRIDEMLNN